MVTQTEEGGSKGLAMYIAAYIGYITSLKFVYGDRSTIFSSEITLPLRILY